MASLCVVVILGGKKPLVVLFTSSCADPLGLVVPMPTCAYTAMLVIKVSSKIKKRKVIFIIKGFHKNNIVNKIKNFLSIFLHF
jgi:hypothetical protein